MGIQSQLNSQALATLPEVYTAIKSADKFESDQMESRALREIMNCNPCLDDMTEAQLNYLDAKLIEIFKYKEWIK